MITEDQLEQLAIQWFQDTGWIYVHGAVIAPEGVAAEREDGGNIEHRTPNIEHRREEKRRLAEAVRIPGSRQISRQSVTREVVGYRDMNRNIVSRFGGNSGRKRGITTEIPIMGLQAISEETSATHKDSLSVKIKSKRG